MKRATIRDVAALAGISPTTVSKVLNGRAAEAIPAGTQERVHRAASELHYHPFAAAQALRQRRTQTVAVVTYDLAPFSAEIVRGVETAAGARGFTTIVATHGDHGDLEAKHLQLGLRHQVDGLVIMPAAANRNQALYDRLRTHGVPFVFVSRQVPSYTADYVGFQNERAAYQLTKALLSAGARTVGYLGRVDAQTNTALAERFDGFARALREQGLTPSPDLCLRRRPDGDRVTDLAALLDRSPRVDGLFWGSYQYVQPCLSVLLARGLRVPGDVRVVGFDHPVLELSEWGDYATLRAIDAPWPVAVQPARAMGESAFALLLDALTEGADRPAQQILLEPELIWLPDGG